MTDAPDFTVERYGTDSSGRAIYMTRYAHAVWERIVDVLGFRPTIVQGGFMTRNGGGAAASEGYHDKAGCWDVRTRDLTTEQVDELVRVCREHGVAAWRRDLTDLHGGMDPHCHLTLGTDSPLTPGAEASWASYKAGRNGLANNRPDYEWRPSPLVLTPPQEKEDDMAWSDPLVKWWPGKTGAKQTATAGQQLNQARGFAQEAYASAKRCEAAIAALAKALGPTVEQAVEKALADSVVDVNVTVNGAGQ